MSDTKHTPWTLAKPGAGKVPATIPIIYDARGNAVAHVLGGQDKAEFIVQAVNSHAALTEALEEIEGGVLGRDDYTPLEAAREMERIARAALALSKDHK